MVSRLPASPNVAWMRVHVCVRASTSPLCPCARVEPAEQTQVNVEIEIDIGGSVREICGPHPIEPAAIGVYLTSHRVMEGPLRTSQSGRWMKWADQPSPVMAPEALATSKWPIHADPFGHVEVNPA